MQKNPYARLRNVLFITLVITFSILIAGGLSIFKNEAPRPSQIVNEQGKTLATKTQLISGQATYERYGLGDYGSYLGDGAYLGPDYSSEALHIYIQGMYKYKAQKLFNKNWSDLSDIQQEGIKGQVVKEIKKNRYNTKTHQLVLTDAQAAGFKYEEQYYHKMFINNPSEAGLPENLIKAHDAGAYQAKGNQVDYLADFFFWGAWLSSTERPEGGSTYTNNFPYDLEAGNNVSMTAITWSAISVAILVAGLGIIIWYERRYNLEMADRYAEGDLPIIDADKAITSSQRKVAKYLVIVVLLFLVQIMLGELMSHFYAENSFFGWNIQNIFPFPVDLTWHLQLVIFWVATSWLATGIYVVPRVLGREPKRQGLLVDLLFWALIIVVAGSMLGEWAGTMGWMGKVWWLFGQYGWKYIELGKFWQVLFIIGMVLWAVILGRGFVPAIRKKAKTSYLFDRKHLATMLFVGALAIPSFYVASLFIMPDSHVTFADYWRWWIVHLWVEGVFEVFAVLLIGWLMVDMRLTTIKSTIRALYFQMILLLGSGVVGIGHHYYWMGDNSIWLALGSSFSALEVVPLCLLVWEAYTHYKVYKDSGVEFPYKGTFIFLAATGLWNAFGAGALGFLINLPAISYFEHGTTWTSAHAHGSMAGVYGMFSIAILLYTMRSVSKKEYWTPKREKMVVWSAWLTNMGLLGMLVITLLPVGYMQLTDAVEHGYWHARLTSFYHSPLVSGLLWARMLPDLVFTAGVIVLIIIVVGAFFNLKPAENEQHEKESKIVLDELAAENK